MIHSQSEDEEINLESDEEQKEEQPNVKIENTGARAKQRKSIQPRKEQAKRHGCRKIAEQPDFFGNTIMVTNVSPNNR